ncbi:protein D7 [Rhipicephalus sanguineus]|uniref:protein D7 n=1 Tax=Rhipicephalus sanguineus TaxID=34632 RepID=UPI001893266E|nr:protein D7 [Rhipicephalus sanguineus]XP_037508146.1 protein D7 [Rhipicephalus sanguineus]XP_037508154.1 protein D7 [Rhipicephalus sanguineus]
MATYQSRQEPLTTCPYNPAHQVKLGRLQIHITKCRKAHQEKDMKQCPFSAEHVVPASQLMHHIYTCPLNTTVERFLTVSEKDKPSGDVALPPAAQDVPTEENWDEEASGSASLEDKIPKPAVAPVFVSVQAMAPAQRRHYYASLHSKADELLPSDMKPRVLPEAKTLEEEEEELLQMPPMPKTESKVLMHLKAMEAMQRKNGAALYEDSDSGDESDQQFKSKVYRMGLGRGYASAAAVKARAEQKSEEDSEAEIRARMRLMGLGRGKPLPRN